MLLSGSWPLEFLKDIKYEYIGVYKNGKDQKKKKEKTLARA